MTPFNRPISIAEAARFLGVSINTLRLWDQQGILKPWSRTAGGHRRYLLSDLTAMRESSVRNGQVSSAHRA